MAQLSTRLGDRRGTNDQRDVWFIAQHASSISTKAACSKPALSKPSDRPPAPAHISTLVIVFLNDLSVNSQAATYYRCNVVGLEGAG